MKRNQKKERLDEKNNELCHTFEIIFQEEKWHTGEKV